MITCTNCGANNEDGSVFCYSCGAGLTADDWNTVIPDSMATPPVMPNPMTPPPVAPTTVNNATYDSAYGRSRFVSADENVIATLKNGMVDNILSGEGFVKEDAVLTNKRLYYKHNHGIISRANVQEIVNVDDITGTKILGMNYIVFLIIGGLSLLIAMFLAVVAEEGFIMIPGIIWTLIWVILYFVTLKKVLRIEYAGGFISFSVKKYGLHNIIAFQKSIHLAKDALK